MQHTVWGGLFFRLCYNKAELKHRNQKWMAQSDKECGEQNTRSPSSLNTGLFPSNEQHHCLVKSLASAKRHQLYCWSGRDFVDFIDTSAKTHQGRKTLKCWCQKRFEFEIGWKGEVCPAITEGYLGWLWALLNCHVQFWNKYLKKGVEIREETSNMKDGIQWHILGTSYFHRWERVRLSSIFYLSCFSSQRKSYLSSKEP